MKRRLPLQERSKETVQAIFEAVRTIVDKEGPNGLTTNNIAKVAGVSIGSLYQYFKNRENILEEVFKRANEDNIRALEKVFEEKDPATTGICEFITTIVEQQFEKFESMGQLTFLLFRLAPKLIPISYIEKNDERIVKYLIKKMKECNFNTQVSHPEHAFFICSQAVRATIYMTFISKSPRDYESVKKELINMLCAYLGA